jgi:hypothetical protein
MSDLLAGFVFDIPCDHPGHARSLWGCRAEERGAYALEMVHTCDSRLPARLIVCTSYAIKVQGSIQTTVQCPRCEAKMLWRAYQRILYPINAPEGTQRDRPANPNR